MSDDEREEGFGDGPEDVLSEGDEQLSADGADSDDLMAEQIAGAGDNVIASGDATAPREKLRARLPEERVTTPYLTKYERARLLGTRALQLSFNAPVMVALEGEVDPLTIAEKELRERRVPFIIRRFLPDNTYEDWTLAELEVDPDRIYDERYQNLA